MTVRPARGFRGESDTEVKRSRFRTTIARVDDEDAARAVVAEVRHTYPDARHHCSAFIVEVDGSRPVERSSDDGEPAGTAGMPMLDVLRGSGLTNVVAVVTRWFGGVKLGTGGLVRAYSDAVSQGLADVPRVVVEVTPTWRLVLGMAEAGSVLDALRTAGIDVLDVEWTDVATVALAHPDEGLVDGTVAALTSGNGVLEAAGERTSERPAVP